GPGDLERTLPLLRAGPAVFEQRVVGNLNLAMCFATECRSVERTLVNLFRLRSADRTRPRHCVSLIGRAQGTSQKGPRQGSGAKLVRHAGLPRRTHDENTEPRSWFLCRKPHTARNAMG